MRTLTTSIQQATLSSAIKRSLQKGSSRGHATHAYLTLQLVQPSREREKVQNKDTAGERNREEKERERKGSNGRVMQSALTLLLRCARSLWTTWLVTREYYYVQRLKRTFQPRGSCVTGAYLQCTSRLHSCFFCVRQYFWDFSGIF